MKTFLVVISAFLLFHDVCGTPPLNRPNVRSKVGDSLIAYLDSIDTVLTPASTALQVLMVNYESLSDENLQTAVLSLSNLFNVAAKFGFNVWDALTDPDQSEGMQNFVDSFNALIAAMAQTVSDVKPMSASVANDLQGSLSDLQASQKDPVFKKNSAGKPLIDAFNKDTVVSIQKAIELCMNAVNKANTAFVPVYQSLTK